MTSATSFGRRLKQLRQAQGLSQGEVGYGRYSASYVSLLERGLRRPTPEVIKVISAHLGVDPVELEERRPGGPGGPGGTGGTGGGGVTGGREHTLTVLELASRNAWQERDYEQALARSRQSAQAAREVGRLDTWWSSTHLQASSLMTLEQYAECRELALELSNHPVALEFPELAVDALTLASRAARAEGLLAVGLQHATEATRLAEQLPPATPQRLRAVLAQVAVLADLGRLEDAVALTGEIRSLREEVGSSHLRGTAAWTLGNLAFMAGDTEQGVAEHALARRHLKPEADLRSWGRFHKAAAAMRVARGDRDVADLIEAAHLALELAGNDSDLRELDLVRAELALNLADPTTAIDLVDKAVDETLPPNTLAEAATLRHRALERLGRHDEAGQALVQAALLFERAGALGRALRAWREHEGVFAEPEVSDDDAGPRPPRPA